MYDETIDIGILVGQVIKSVEGIDCDDVYIETESGDCFRIYHSQDCCESVGIYDCVGELQNVIGSKVVSASEYTTDTPDDVTYEPSDSYTWTIYTIKTEKGSFKIRWLGESNGYYGETPYFMRSHTKY